MSFVIQSTAVGVRYTSTSSDDGLDTPLPATQAVSPTGAGTVRFSSPLPAVAAAGSYRLVLFVNGRELPSAYALLVRPSPCVGAAVSGKGGACVCPPGYRTVPVFAGTSCAPLPPSSGPVLSGPAIGGLAAGCIVAMACILGCAAQHAAGRANRGWLIPRSHIHFVPEPGFGPHAPPVLGTGRAGPVFAGVYQGTSVAVKRARWVVAPPPQGAAAKGREPLFPWPHDHVKPSPSRRTSAASGGGGATPRDAVRLAVRNDAPESPADAGPHAPPPASRLWRWWAALRRGGPSVSAAPASPSWRRSNDGGGLSPAGAGATMRLSGFHPPRAAAAAHSGDGTSSRSRLWALRGAVRAWREERACRAAFVSEMRLFESARSPHILQLLGGVIDPASAAPLYVMEAMEKGALCDLLRNDTLELDADVLLPILRDTATGLAFLHAAGIVHGDVTSGNVLVDGLFRAKVADLRLSFRAAAPPPRPAAPPAWDRDGTSVLPSPAGHWGGGGASLPHASPQLLRGDWPPSPASDAYAFAMLCCEAVTRRDPFDGEGPLGAALDAVRDGPRPPARPRRPFIGAGVPPQLMQLMGACWEEAPGARPVLAEAAEVLAACVARALLEPASTAGRHSSAAGGGGGRGARAHSRAERAASAANANAVSLLHAVFPPDVAAELAAGKAVEPRSYERVTIFFSDIVGFTDLSGRLPPLKIMNMLDRLYRVFDELTAMHSLFKVETSACLFTRFLVFRLLMHRLPFLPPPFSRRLVHVRGQPERGPGGGPRGACRGVRARRGEGGGGGRGGPGRPRRGHHPHPRRLPLRRRRRLRGGPLHAPLLPLRRHRQCVAATHRLTRAPPPLPLNPEPSTLPPPPRHGVAHGIQLRGWAHHRLRRGCVAAAAAGAPRRAAAPRGGAHQRERAAHPVVAGRGAAARLAAVARAHRVHVAAPRRGARRGLPLAGAAQLDAGVAGRRPRSAAAYVAGRGRQPGAVARAALDDRRGRQPPPPPARQHPGVAGQRRRRGGGGGGGAPAAARAFGGGRGGHHAAGGGWRRRRRQRWRHRGGTRHAGQRRDRAGGGGRPLKLFCEI